MGRNLKRFFRFYFWLRRKIIFVFSKYLRKIIITLWSYRITKYLYNFQYLLFVVLILLGYLFYCFDNFEIFLSRFVLFLIICFFIIIYKLFYNLIIKLDSKKVKQFYKKHNLINKLSLFVVKWTNLYYIYNDVLIIIIKILKIIRYYKKTYLKKNNIKLDEKIYVIFFIIIKNTVLTLVDFLKLIKINLIEKSIIEIIKKRLWFWIIIMLFLLIFSIKINIYFLLVIFIIKSFDNIVYDYLRRKERQKYFTEKYKYENITYSPTVYEKWGKSLYLFKYCTYSEDYNPYKINLLATKKLVNREENRFIKMYNDDFYWFQEELYYRDIGNELEMLIIMNIIKLLQLNILYIINLQNEINKKRSEIRKRKESVEVLKEYIEVLLEFKEIWEIFQNYAMYSKKIYKIRVIFIRYDDDEIKFYEKFCKKMIKFEIENLMEKRGRRGIKFKKEKEIRELEERSKIKEIENIKENYKNYKEKEKKVLKKSLIEKYEKYYKKLREVNKKEKEINPGYESNKLCNRIKTGRVLKEERDIMWKNLFGDKSYFDLNWEETKKYIDEEVKFRWKREKKEQRIKKLLLKVIPKKEYDFEREYYFDSKVAWEVLMDGLPRDYDWSKNASPGAKKIIEAFLKD